MASFEQLLTKLEPGEARVMRELDRRFALAQALMQKVLPDSEIRGKDYADVLLQFFDNVDDFLDSVDEDDDEDED